MTFLIYKLKATVHFDKLNYLNFFVHLDKLVKLLFLEGNSNIFISLLFFLSQLL